MTKFISMSIPGTALRGEVLNEFNQRRSTDKDFMSFGSFEMTGMQFFSGNEATTWLEENAKLGTAKLVRVQDMGDYFIGGNIPS